jgi:F-type H+-transporting ATPase subunit b
MNVTATLFGQMITFAILVWFVMKYLWGPLTAAMDNRKQRVADGLAQAEKGKLDLELAEKGATKRLSEAKEQASTIISRAETRASEIIETAKADAKQEATRANTAAKAELEQEIQQAREALRGQLGKLVVSGAGKILKKEVNAAEHDRLLSDLAAKL